MITVKQSLMKEGADSDRKQILALVGAYDRIETELAEEVANMPMGVLGGILASLVTDREDTTNRVDHLLSTAALCKLVN